MDPLNKYAAHFMQLGMMRTIGYTSTKCEPALNYFMESMTECAQSAGNDPNELSRCIEAKGDPYHFQDCMREADNSLQDRIERAKKSSDLKKHCGTNFDPKEMEKAGFDVKPSNPGKCIEAIESFWERTIPEAEYPSDTESAQVLLQLYMMSAQAAQQQDGYNY